MPLIDVAMCLDDLFQWVAAVYDRTEDAIFKKPFDKEQLFYAFATP